MNSEELERSLRDEFENYLKGVVAELKQQTAEFQQRINAEFDRQRQAADEAFAAFSASFDSGHSFDEAFISTVNEHLKLARDEGAMITATAFAEAEKLEEETAQQAAQSAQQPTSYDAIRDAVNDISSKDSQSSILKALVGRAAEFAPRGAFFIIKNEHLAGWKVFGEASDHADGAIRDIHFPVADDSILGAAIRSAETIESGAGEHSADSAFMDPLGFGHPTRIYAVPLIARGRAVAVLYADHGNDGTQFSREALETLVRVAGLTVELHAAAVPSAAAEHSSEDLQPASEHVAPSFEEAQPAAEPAPEFEQPEQDFSFSESVSYEGGFPQAESEEGYREAAPEYQSEHDEQPSQDDGAKDDSEVYDSGGSIEAAGFPEGHGDSPFEHPAEEPTPHFDTEPQFEPAPSFEPAQQFEPAPVAAFEPALVAPTIQAPEKSVVPVPGSRLSDRPVDLPIEVPEEERRSHNDARRFARLLVSEIKLYNEKKVLEGREHRDLYERLKEAIDRSREMYDKRVQPPVAAKFDYFHYEMVNSLAEGEPGRLGSGYPGPTV